MTRNVAIDTNTHRHDEPVKSSVKSYRTEVMEPGRGPDTARVVKNYYSDRGMRAVGSLH